MNFTHTTFKRISGFMIAAFFAGFIYTACDITDPTEGLRVILNTKERTTTVSVIFVDAATNNPVGFNENTGVSVTFTGPDSDKIIDLVNRQSESFESKDGFLSFAVIDELSPSTDNPLKFTIVASADGYITTSKPVRITNTRNNPFEVFMVNKSNLPSGVNGTTTDFATVSGGVIESDTDLITPTESESGTRAFLNIAEGTVITDADGNTLEGTLTADFYLFSNASDEAMQAFPGGFNADVVKEQGDNDTVFFTTGGFVSLTITDSQGRRARNFAPAAQLGIEMNPGTADHENNTVTEGDTAPIWSYDDETGEWSFETNTVVSRSDNGLLMAEFDLEHLSWWNIDWFGNTCFNGVRVNLLNNNMQLRGKLLRSDNDMFLGWAPSRNIPGSPSFIQFINAPQNVPGYLELYDITDNMVASVDLPDLCTSSPVDVDLGGVSSISVTFKGIGTCANRDDIEIRPNFPAWYKPANGGQWVSAGNVVNGEIAIEFPAPGSYIFGAFFEGEFYQYELDLSDTEDGTVFDRVIQIPESLCSQL